MIRNERQYHTTMRKRQMLAEALEELSRSSGLPSVSWDTPDQVDREAFIVELQQASLVGQLADLDAELQEYRQLQTGEILASRVTSLDDLPDALVRARIAAGLSQRDLAARLGMKEQQVQRYEADRYASASLTRLRTVMEALDVQLEGDIRLPATETPSNQLRRRLLEWGFDRRVIDRRLLRDLGGDAGQTKVLAAIERVARLLMVPMQQLLAPTTDVPSLATTARFQAPRNAATGRLDAYTRYAEGLADIVLRATAHLPPPRLPGDARAVRSAMDHIAASMASAARGTHKDSETLLHAALRYTADLGVPVIALSDPGAFHGACFTRDGRSVIVLKHASDSPARWLAVLLHELDHLSDPNRNEPRTWIELGDIDTWSDNPEEQHAHAFAADILFYGRADAVLTQAATVAGGSVERLKAIVPAVAEQAEVPADVLANYLAFQLAQRGLNWWGTANTFQQPGTPQRMITDQLLTQLDFNKLDSIERAALMDALAP